MGVLVPNDALYPHMTAAQGIPFPLRVPKAPRAEMEACLVETLAPARDRGRGIHVEIKEAASSARRAVVAATCILAGSVFRDHRPERLDALRAAPEARSIARRQDGAGLEQALGSHGGPAPIGYMPEDDGRDVHKTRAASVPVMIWDIGRDPRIMDRVIPARPLIVNIDDSLMFRRRLAARLGW